MIGTFGRAAIFLSRGGRNLGEEGFDVKTVMPVVMPNESRPGKEFPGRLMCSAGNPRKRLFNLIGRGQVFERVDVLLRQTRIAYDRGFGSFIARQFLRFSVNAAVGVVAVRDFHR